METACYDLSFGTLCVRYEGEILYGLSLTEERWGGEGVRAPFSDRTAEQVRQYLAGQRKTFDIPYCLQGTPFQLKVWHALETIPYGEVRTYGEIARQTGNAGAARAVGGACNKNPVGVIVPCHRVIGADGKLTGYAGGLPVKQRLLSLEKKIAEK